MHHPVLLHEVIKGLNIRPGSLYIDATVGEGGYTIAILKRGGKVLAIDWDEMQILNLKSQISKIEKGKNCYLTVGNFAEIETIAKKYNFYPVDGIVFDLGLSMQQLENSGRGFSFKKVNEPLDMRLSKSINATAADLINNLTKEDLYEIFTKYSEEINSRTIADFIVSARSLKRIQTVGDLVSVISKKSYARIFQALRIAVNDEFNNLKKGLNGSLSLLKTEGKLAVVTFHSLEDRIVKKFVRERNLRFLPRKPITAKHGRSFERSAKLRIFSF